MFSKLYKIGNVSITSKIDFTEAIMKYTLLLLTFLRQCNYFQLVTDFSSRAMEILKMRINYDNNKNKDKTFIFG